MNHITIVAVDKDSNQIFSQQFPLNQELEVHLEEFQKDVPFRRYYLDAFLEDEPSPEEKQLLQEVGLWWMVEE